MNKVYRHKPIAPDDYLGHVNERGQVYASRRGPDQLVGRVELETGKIYESRLGPDRYIGRVDANSGKVYLSQLGPDEYLGRVHRDGKLTLHIPLGADEYLGKVVDMTSLAHGGAAFLLLVQPVLDAGQVKKEEKEQQEQARRDFKKDPGTAPDAGSSPAPA